MHCDSTSDKFTSEYKSVNITLTVAKKNITMQAIGVGTCILHCVDNLYRPCKIVLKNVLHVPLAKCSMFSTSALSAQGYQAVLPSSAATFTPGLYFPCSGAAAPRFIRFNTINGLHYISSRHDHPEPLQPTAANAAVRFSRKLGHCSLQNPWDTRPRGFVKWSRSTTALRTFTFLGAASF